MQVSEYPQGLHYRQALPCSNGQQLCSSVQPCAVQVVAPPKMLYTFKGAREVEKWRVFSDKSFGGSSDAVLVPSPSGKASAGIIGATQSVKVTQIVIYPIFDRIPLSTAVQRWSGSRKQSKRQWSVEKGKTPPKHEVSTKSANKSIGFT